MIENENQKAGNKAATIRTTEFVKPAHNLRRTVKIKPAMFVASIYVDQLSTINLWRNKETKWIFCLFICYLLYTNRDVKKLKMIFIEETKQTKSSYHTTSGGQRLHVTLDIFIQLLYINKSTPLLKFDVQVKKPFLFDIIG